MLEVARRLDEIAEDDGQDQDVRDRARQQAGRAHSLDTLIRKSAQAGKTIRVVLNEGKMRSEENIGEESSVVKVRRLDNAFWAIDAYNAATGDFTLTRQSLGTAAISTPVAVATDSPRDAGTPAAGEEHGFAQVADGRDFVDQKTALGTDLPPKMPLTGDAYVRDRRVRDAALRRAGGQCEFCAARGFLTASGQVYLETHHVIPLSENGADREWNVAALCPNDHREAHFGERASQIRSELLDHLDGLYPHERRESSEARYQPHLST
ncbi:HNH endonuclease [Ramlibacter terrae]|uniref:HNH endonuclease n=1 Tax=Ramlibacter terrae TaxID=2732511 RepID=A0ABX6NZJ9_9BURK|nr:HNH endonuclease [Ramlibacter terrae]